MLVRKNLLHLFFAAQVVVIVGCGAGGASDAIPELGEANSELPTSDTGNSSLVSGSQQFMLPPAAIAAPGEQESAQESSFTTLPETQELLSQQTAEPDALQSEIQEETTPEVNTPAAAQQQNVGGETDTVSENTVAEQTEAPETSNPAETEEKTDLVSTGSDSNSAEAAVEPESVATDKYVVVGSNPGDASCLNLTTKNIGFGSVTHSDWGTWLGGEPRFSIGREFLAVEDDWIHDKVLRQKFVPNHKGTEWVAIGKNIEGHRTYRVVQSFFFEEGFHWGGERYQGGKLGFGFGSGTYPTGGTNDPKGFTARLAWKGNRDGTAQIVIYSYAADRTKQYGEDIFLGEAPAPVGEWVNIVMEITANTATDKYDGSMRGWVNGELVVDKRDIGWQLAGDQPMIDSLFYMGFYGGGDSQWSPSFTTYMKTGSVCWSPVVDGYSGIDPDAGRITVDPESIPNSPLNDDSGEENVPKWKKNGLNLRGLIDQTRLGLNLTTYRMSQDVAHHYYQAADQLSALSSGIQVSAVGSLSDNPTEHLYMANTHLQEALALHTEEGSPDVETLGNLAKLREITVGVVDFAVSVADQSREISNCASTASIFCMNSQALYNDVLAAEAQMNEQIDTDLLAAIGFAEQAWNSSAAIVRNLNND